jgi:ketosteroid isomerase-like protein
MKQLKGGFMKKLIVLVLIPFIFIKAQLTLDEVKTKISEMQKEQIELMLAGNTDEGLKFYCKEAYSLPSYEPMLHGMDEFKKSAEEWKKTGMKFTDFKLNTVDVLMGGNLAVEIGTYSMTMEMPGMPMPIDDKGKYVTVYGIHEDGSLKIKIETWNSDINPWEEMEKGPPPPPPAPEKK